MYFMYCNVYEFTMHWAVVSGGTCVGLMYKFLSSLLRLIQHITVYCIYTVGSGQCAGCPAQHSRCNACILTTLYTYDPECDARMGATCTLVSCHVWLCRVRYECHIYVMCFSQLYVMLLVSCEFTHLHTSCKSF